MPVDEPESRPDAGPRPKTDHVPPILEAQAGSLDTSPPDTRPPDARPPDAKPPEISNRSPDRETKTSAPTATSPPANRFRLLCGVIGFACLALLAGYSWLQAESALANQTGLKNEVETLQVRVEANEKRMGDRTATLPGAAALEQRLAALETRKPSDAAPADAIAALDKRIAAAETLASSAADSLARQTQIERRIAALETTPKPVASSEPASAPVDLSPVESRLATLEAKLGALETALAAPKSDARATGAPLSPTAREPDGAALASIALSIRSALERGEGFAAELAAAKALGADPARIAGLEPVAQNGARTLAGLVESWRPLKRAMKAAIAPPKTEASGLLDQLSDAASKLVRVRPTTRGELDSDPAAIVDQIEIDLENGALLQAVAAWNRLPETARKASQSWGEDASRRVAANAAARSLFEAAIADAGRKRSAP